MDRAGAEELARSRHPRREGREPMNRTPSDEAVIFAATHWATAEQRRRQLSSDHHGVPTLTDALALRNAIEVEVYWADQLLAAVAALAAPAAELAGEVGDG